MQKTLLIGYLGRDPEMKYTPGGTAIATFTIASTERWKNSAGEPQEHTEWFNIKVFGKQHNQRRCDRTNPLAAANRCKRPFDLGDFRMPSYHE